MNDSVNNQYNQQLEMLKPYEKVFNMFNQWEQDERKSAQQGHTFSPLILPEINLPTYKSPLKLNFQNPFSKFDNKFNKILNSDYSSLTEDDKTLKLDLPTTEDYLKNNPLEVQSRIIKGKLEKPSQLVKPIKPPKLDVKFETKELTGFQKGWQKVNKFMNSKGAQMGMQALGIGMNFLGDNDKDINSWDTATKQLRNGIADSMLASGNPWLMAGALGIKGFGKLGAFGDSTKGLGAGNDILNTVGSFVPGVGWVAGKSKEIQKDENVLASSSFTGVADDVNNAAQNAGGKFLFGMDKANRRIDRANLAQNQASQILDDNRLAKQSSNHPLYQMRTQMLTSGGYNPTSTYAKMGAKLYNIEEAKRILNNRLQSFKNGGAVNVIPDGALHKNRHHLEDIDEKFEDVTTKGIPVITEAKNGDVIQQAEVEKEEIIFNLAVTKKLEELMEKGTDEAAIEAGKLLTEEILRNTIDNTNKLL